MCKYLPITLTEETLGSRHRQFNHLIDEAYKSGITFQDVENLPEQSALDRLFKIELASKFKNIDYILKNIKDEDLLYVSKALKCKWLLDEQYQSIINPTFLENELFPHMVTPAVGKFKNWLYINLKKFKRCEEFYKFYVEKNFALAIKFLSNCGNTFIIDESVNVLHKLSPHQLKILFEKCPKVAELYFKNIVTDETIKSAVLAKRNEYFESLKMVLKREPDIFFDISEKYFDNKFNKHLTKFIISHHKHRFISKPELYTARMLHIETLAESLSVIECKEIVLKLARAKYLKEWFTYKNLEPIIKRLPVGERVEIKKRIFVDKHIEEEVLEWPYELPCLPIKETINSHIFDDKEPSPQKYEYLKRKKVLKRAVKKKKGKMEEYCFIESCQRIKTYLDLLFEEYRFTSFGKTLFELRQRIRVESSSQNREYILLVLVSKSGGQPENLASLLELLVQHSNEPIHVKAAVTRSLVKRAAVWRLPQETWYAFLEFSRGIGLDGEDSGCQCYEGLHAVVIRNLLEVGNCEPKIRDAFIKHFSKLVEYKLTLDEKNILKIRLPELILDASETETSFDQKAYILELLFDTLKAYKVPIETSSLIFAVKTLANQNFYAAQNLLSRLFLNKIARRSFFHENFLFIFTDASYLNALRHNMSVLDINVFLNLIEENKLCPTFFLQKISIYFSENGGLMETYLEKIKERALLTLNASLSKPLSILLGADKTFISGFNLQRKGALRFVAAFKANMHKGRKKLGFNEADLNVIGAKAIANKVIISPVIKVESYYKILLKWRRTVKLGVVLSQRIGKEADAFKIAATVRSVACLKSALKYFRRLGDSFDIRVWKDAVKPILENLDFTLEKRHHLRNFVSKVNYVPSTIRLEYCMILYNCFINSSFYKAMTMLCHIELQFPNISDSFVENVLIKFLNEINSGKYESEDIKYTLLHVRILVKYLMIAKEEEVQRNRFRVFGEKLLNCLEFRYTENYGLYTSIYEEIMSTLQNNKIFFDTSNSPLFVMENIVSWMHKYFPIELHFGKYVHIHLIMLYYKAIRQSIELMPDVFCDKRKKMTVGIDIVGEIFGQYIASEVKSLMLKYFDSIIEIYKDHFCEYFSNYFQHGAPKNRFLLGIIRGIIKNSTGTESKIGVYLLQNSWWKIDKSIFFEFADEITRKQILESKFFLFAELYT